MKKRIFFRRPFQYEYRRRVLFIIFINFLIYALGYFYNFVNDYVHTYGSLCAYLVLVKHMYWQFFTYMFVHHNLSHVFFNMLGLLVFGLPLEKAIGSKEFTLFYIVCGVASGVLSFLVFIFTRQYIVFLLGASGAVYAVLFAYAVFFPRSIIYIWGLVPVPAPIMVLIYALIEFFSQFTSVSNVAHMTHLFGFLAAWLYFVIRMGIHPLKIWKNTYK